MKSAWSNSVSPLIAGLVTAAIFVAGAGAFELGRAGEAVPVSSPAEPPATEASFDPVLPVMVEPSEGVADIPPIDTRPLVALVIDDAGIDPELTRRAMELPAALTLSFLPYAEETRSLVTEARAQGHDIFLHLPMEPFGLEDPGPGALTRHLTPSEMAFRIGNAFERVPGAVGFNNHMGSAFTTDERALSAAFAGLTGRDLVFLDSLTSGRSRAYHIASEAGLTALRRDVFIDHVAGQERAFLDAMAERARSEGRVIAIAHPRPGTIAALTDWLAEPDNQDVRFVTISQLLAADQPDPVSASGETVSLLGGTE